MNLSMQGTHGITSLAASRRFSRPATLGEWLQWLPRFTRQPLAPQPGLIGRGPLARHDLIVRDPAPGWPEPAVVGLVSPRYRLIQHHEVLERVAAQLQLASSQPVQCQFSRDGARFGFAVLLSAHQAFDPGDGHELRQFLGGINSVDRSSGVRAFRGWLRQVCSNGLVQGTIAAEFRQRHTRELKHPEFALMLHESQQVGAAEQQQFARWYRTSVGPRALEDWVNARVAATWGAGVATRVHHILTTGHDVEVVPFSAPAPPSEKAVRQLDPVPGAAPAAHHLYAVAQALSWIASHRRDPQERLRWQQAIPQLLEPLGAVP